MKGKIRSFNLMCRSTCSDTWLQSNEGKTSITHAPVLSNLKKGVTTRDMAPTTRSTNNKDSNKPASALNEALNVNPLGTNVGQANTPDKAPELIPKLVVGTPNQATPLTVESRLDLVIEQMNKLTKTVNSVSLQFHQVEASTTKQAVVRGQDGL